MPESSSHPFVRNEFVGTKLVAKDNRPRVTDAELRHCAEEIVESWNKQLENIIATGRLLIKRQKALHHGDWGKLFQQKLLPFGQETARQLMAIAKNKVLTNSKFSWNLPPSWPTLFQLTQFAGNFGDDVLVEHLESGQITGDTTRADVERLTEHLMEDEKYNTEGFCRSIEKLIKFMARWPDATDAKLVGALHRFYDQQTLEQAISPQQLLALAEWQGQLGTAYQRKIETASATGEQHWENEQRQRRKKDADWYKKKDSGIAPSRTSVTLETNTWRSEAKG